MRASFAHLEQYRKQHPSFIPTRPGERVGLFRIPCPPRVSPTSGDLVLIVSEANPLVAWDHVSLRVDLADGKQRCPTWDEMCWVKDMFWEDDECVVQFHPPKSQYVNNHASVLHLWKSAQEMPTPPSIAVGIKSLGTLPGTQARHV